MRLEDLSSRLRRERVAFALKVALQDLKAPAPTMDVVRMIAARLETDEMHLIGRIIVSMAPAIPQAHQSSAAFKQYGREMRPWVWSPIGYTPPAAEPLEALAWRGKVYASQDALDAAKASEWEIES